MAARPLASREPSLHTVDSLSRRSSLGSNPDIFSDDYALEPIDSNLNLSVTETIDSDETIANGSFTPYPAIPNRLSVPNRPSSTSKRPAGNASSASSRDAASMRTLSVSSRSSAVRAQSPYRGPTRPSHPYSMYPQVTRASSIASSSTVRPQERPFVSTGGPEHPYSLYPQNTVEDDDEDIGMQPIPLGFSALGYGSNRGPSNPDIGDIVLLDGHIEQLPPYTRYADNVVAKGDMADVPSNHVVEMDATTSARSSLMRAETLTSHSGSPVAAPATTNESEAMLADGEARKEGWRETAKKKVCGGIALWLLLVIIVVVLLAGLLGGVVGGVVGRHQGATEAKNAADTFRSDAAPAYTGSTPTIPVGKYNIPFNLTAHVDKCVSQRQFSESWSCMDIAYLGISISQDATGCSTVQFEDYSTDPSTFLYGPQPPDFNGTAIVLEPHMDNNDQDLGVAMFFLQQFDKLVILPSDEITPTPKRSISESEVLRRRDDYDERPLNVGDCPWYCFWNQTISEFWIFLDRATNGTNITTSETTSSSGVPVATPVSASTNTYFPNQKWRSQSSSYENQQSDPLGAPTPTDWTTYQSKQKRDYTAPGYFPEYPRLVKMVEKRASTNSVAPYCQQMRVLDNWNIVPQEGGATIKIIENDYGTPPAPQSSSTSSKRDTPAELASNCFCEWMST